VAKPDLPLLVTEDSPDGVAAWRICVGRIMDESGESLGPVIEPVNPGIHCADPEKSLLILTNGPNMVAGEGSGILRVVLIMDESARFPVKKIQSFVGGDP